jgi:hypothetical protein
VVRSCTAICTAGCTSTIAPKQTLTPKQTVTPIRKEVHNSTANRTFENTTDKDLVPNNTRCKLATVLIVAPTDFHVGMHAQILIKTSTFFVRDPRTVFHASRITHGAIFRSFSCKSRVHFVCLLLRTFFFDFSLFRGEEAVCPSLDNSCQRCVWTLRRTSVENANDLSVPPINVFMSSRTF